MRFVEREPHVIQLGRGVVEKFVLDTEAVVMNPRWDEAASGRVVDVLWRGTGADTGQGIYIPGTGEACVGDEWNLRRGAVNVVAFHTLVRHAVAGG